MVIKLKIDIGKEFSSILRNRNSKQTDGLNTGESFRTRFLSGDIDTQEWWDDDSKSIEIDFSNVSTLGPSWANEVFAYFTIYNVNFPKIQQKFGFKGLDDLWEEIIEEEVTQGYSGAD